MIYCISDLHLGDKGPRDNFHVRGVERLYRFLDYVDEQRGALIVLGDLFEWWQTNLSVSVLAYRELIDRLAALGTTWVLGNHDNALEGFRGTSMMPNHQLFRGSQQAFDRRIGGKLFSFAHGHEWDATCADLNPGVGALTAIISGMLEDKNQTPGTVEDQFIGALEWPLNLWRSVTHREDRRKELLDGADKYRRIWRSDVLVCGHTHEAGQLGNYYNTGCWCRDLDTFARIEDDGQINIFEWTGTEAKPYNKELT